MQLKKSTLAVGSTFTDLEYRMVLDNVALQRERPGALPWHLKLTQGIVQISDTANPTLAGTWASPSSGTATLSGTRNWQESWTVVPETDSGNLFNLLTKVYSKAATNAWIHCGPPPPDAVSGHYGKTTVWVGKDHVKDLTELTMAVLVISPITASERGIILPNLPGK